MPVVGLVILELTYFLEGEGTIECADNEVHEAWVAEINLVVNEAHAPGCVFQTKKI